MSYGLSREKMDAGKIREKTVKDGNPFNRDVMETTAMYEINTAIDKDAVLLKQERILRV